MTWSVGHSTCLPLSCPLIFSWGHHIKGAEVFLWVPPPGELPLGLFQKCGIRGALDSEGPRGSCSKSAVRCSEGRAQELRQPWRGGDRGRLLLLLETGCLTNNNLISTPALEDVELVLVPRLEPRASDAKAGLFLSAPRCLLPWEVLREAEGSEDKGVVF